MQNPACILMSLGRVSIDQCLAEKLAESAKLEQLKRSWTIQDLVLKGKHDQWNPGAVRFWAPEWTGLQRRRLGTGSL